MIASDRPRTPLPTSEVGGRSLDATLAAATLKHWRSILLAGLVGALLGLGATFLMHPQYTSTARLFFTVQGGTTATDLNAGSTFAERQLASYAKLAKEPMVLEAVHKSMNMDGTVHDLQQKVATRVEPDTVMLSVSVEDPDPQRAAEIANAVASQLTKTVQSLTPQKDGQETVKATITAHAVPPVTASSPSRPMFLIGGGLLGLMLAATGWMAREVLNTRVRHSEDLAKVTDVALIGEVPLSKSEPSASHLFVTQDAGTPTAEAIRTAFTKLRFSTRKRDEANVILFTSSVPGEGKSTLSSNIAAAMAETGARTLLIDVDLRRPSVAEYMSLEGGAGLTTVLIGDAEVEDVVQHVPDSEMDIITSGPIPPNVPELLGSEDMDRFIQGLRHSYDYIVLDAPPVLPVADSLVLSAYADAVVLVTNSQGTRTHQVRKSLESLSSVHATVTGVVLNKMRGIKIAGYYGQYTYDRAPERRGSDTRRARRAVVDKDVGHKEAVTL